MHQELAENWYRLVIDALIIISVAALFCWLQKKTKFARLSYLRQQLIMGVAFGGVAILATEFGITVVGATINVRDAVPITAGMLFGGPAGIISGIMGGVERWFAAEWGNGQFTRLASSLAAVVSGVVGAMLHYWVFRGRRPTWWYALCVSLCLEVIHMLLIFVTNMDNLAEAFGFIEVCTVPMIAANCISVMGATIVVRYLDGSYGPSRKERLEYILQRSLFFSVVVAMTVSALFIWMLQSSLIIEKTRSLLRVQLEDVPRGVRAALNAGLVGYADWLAETMTAEEGSNITSLPTLVQDTVKEAFLIAPATGRIVFSTEQNLVGRSLPVEWQEEFDYALGTNGYITSYGPSFVDGENVKYAMIFLQDGRALIIGFKADFVRSELGRHVQFEAQNRHVGETGYIMMIDEDGHIDSSNGEMRGTLESLGYTMDGPPNTVLLNSVGPTATYYMYDTMDTSSGGSYLIIAAIPVEEASFVSNLAMYITAFMEIVIFTVLFMKVASLIRREVVGKLETVNTSLMILTAGNLDEVVDVRSAEEFSALSDGINATVEALKRTSAEAQRRMERELEFARTVQKAALPSVFPPFPARKDFEIYASMDAAKVVGGDFYDFYLLNDLTLAFLIADVSGKGVPAAMFMMRAKTQIKDLIETGMDVAEVFSRTNKALYENNSANMFVTAWMGVLDLSTGELRYVNAGHTPPLLKRHRERFQYLNGQPDFVLGGLDDVTYESGVIQMEPGDTLFIYTDGVTEAENDAEQQFGEERLLETVQRNADDELDALCRNVLADVEVFAGDTEQFDDITMLAVRLDGLMSRSSIRLRPEPEFTAAALNFAEQRLAELEVPPDKSAEVMAAVRRVWNAMLHSEATQVELTMRREDDGLFVSFEDNGPPGTPDVLESGADLLVCSERDNDRNVLEMHWRMDEPED